MGEGQAYDGCIKEMTGHVKDTNMNERRHVSHASLGNN